VNSGATADPIDMGTMGTVTTDRMHRSASGHWWSFRERFQSERVQGTERKDDDLPGVDGSNYSCLVVELGTSHGQRPRVSGDPMGVMI
jgi:hypothetical protein